MTTARDGPDIVEAAAARPRSDRSAWLLRLVVGAVVVIVLAGGWWYTQLRSVAGRDASVLAAAGALRAVPAGYDGGHLDIAFTNPRTADIAVASARFSYGPGLALTGHPVPVTARVRSAPVVVAAGGSATLRFRLTGASACSVLSQRPGAVRLVVLLPSGGLRDVTVRLEWPVITPAGTAWRTSLGTFHCGLS